MSKASNFEGETVLLIAYRYRVPRKNQLADETDTSATFTTQSEDYALRNQCSSQNMKHN